MDHLLEILKKIMSQSNQGVLKENKEAWKLAWKLN